MLYIRVDGNQYVATGHLMRCLSIAAAAEQKGEKCVFITSEQYSKELLQNRGYEVLYLKTAWNEMEKELPELTGYIHNLHISLLLVDSYYVTEHYLQALRQHVRIAYIDDLNQFHYDVDILINYNVYASLFPYEAVYKNTKLLLGCDFVPLREEFYNLKPHDIEDKMRLLITTGGTDQFRAGRMLLNGLLNNGQFSDYEIHIILGALNQDMAFIKQMALGQERIMVHENVSNISEWMSKCQLAVSAGGSTLYELCACGIPTVTFSFADNQLYAVKYFDQAGLMPYGGDLRNDAHCIDRVLEQVNCLMHDKKRRKMLSGKMQTLVDGRGAGRIADALFG